MVAALDHGEEEASLADLGLLVGLSANHFCRNFARFTRQPPQDWMTERRVDRAKAVMTDPRLGLTEIALAVCYTSQSTLDRTFARSRRHDPFRVATGEFVVSEAGIFARSRDQGLGGHCAQGAGHG